MLAVFGGTFDPVHYGHLRTALEIKAAFALREVRLLPCANPAHRTQPLSSAEHRAAMLQLAVQAQEGLVVDCRELQRTGASYTVDSLRELRAAYGKETLLLCIGMDAFMQLTRWHCWQELFSYAHVVVLSRPDSPLVDDLIAQQAFFKTRLCSQQVDLQRSSTGLLYFQRVTALAISATAIRHLLATGGNPRFLLPDAVLAYIKTHHLYC